MENTEQPKPSVLSLLSPAQLFFGGIFTGLLILCTLGFFVMLGMYMKNGVRGGNNDGYAVVQQNGQGQQADDSGAPSAPVKVTAGHFPVLGKSSAPVSVVVFADFRCPFCERFYQDAEKSIIKDYVASGKVKLSFRNWAFLGPESTAVAEAAECANEQGKFWQFHDWMYEHQASESDLAYYSNDNIIKYAVGVGVNKAKFTQCLSSHKYAAQVNQDYAEGQQAGVGGTPTTYVNGVKIVGAQPYSAVKAAIEQALAK